MGNLPAPGGTITLIPSAPGVLTLSAQWLAEDGRQLATNQLDLACVDSPTVTQQLRVIDNPALAATLRELGYPVVTADAIGANPNEEIIVTSHYTQELEAHIQQGGRVLLLVNAESQEIPLPLGQVAAREGTPWQGDWANSFAWIRKKGALAHLPGSPLLEMEWARIMPEAVIAGLPSWVLCDHSWAGLAVGWIHKAASLLTVLKYGRGQILITTFKLNADTLASDAIGQALFAGLVNML